MTHEEIRAALAQVLLSPTFQASPKLSSFLRFVVEAALNGQAERIKGYTIAVEALGRDQSFDPQADSIVRVEAARLRRALEAYYADLGSKDPIAIELPRGSYVPVFSRRVTETIAPAPLLVSSAPRRAGRWAAQPRWIVGSIASFAALALAVAVFRETAEQPLESTDKAIYSLQRVQTHRALVGPLVSVETIKSFGSPIPGINITWFGDALRDAIARFDEINVMSDVPQAHKPAADYRVSADVHFHADQTATVSVRLIDAASDTIAWTKKYEHQRFAGELPHITPTQIVREVTTTLFQPLGTIYARERLKQAAGQGSEPRYRCLMDAHEYLRSYDHAQYHAVRACLEQAVAADTTFASGFTALARIYLREYQVGPDDSAARESMLAQAFAAANRAIEINPDSARAYYALSEVSLARGDFAQAGAAAAKAVALNPYDMIGIAQQAAILILRGDVEGGRELISEISAESSVPSVRLDFLSFLAAYMQDDIRTAAIHAKRLVNARYPLGAVARAVVAYREHEALDARHAFDQLKEIKPAWVRDPRHELDKFIPVPLLADHLAADLLSARQLVATD